jgi:hypothetical protein
MCDPEMDQSVQQEEEKFEVVVTVELWGLVSG